MGSVRDIKLKDFSGMADGCEEVIEYHYDTIICDGRKVEATFCLSLKMVIKTWWMLIKTALTFSLVWLNFRDFFLTVGPLPPVLKISYFRKLAIVNSLLFGDVNLLPLSCQFYNSEMSFSRTWGAIPLKCIYQSR